MQHLYVEDIGILDEKVVSFLAVKHLLMLMLAAVFLWAWMGRGSASLMLPGIIIAVFTLISALFPKRSMSLEGYIIGSLMVLVEILGWKLGKK